MIRILHIFSTLEVGGVQMRFRRLVEGLGKDFQHRVFAMDGCYDSIDEFAFTVPVEKLQLDYAKPTTPGDFWRFRQALSASDVRLMITYNWGSVEWGMARLTAPWIPHIDIEDGFGPDEVAARLPRRNKMRRLVYGMSSGMVVPSRQLERIARDEWHVPRRKINYIPNGVDLSRFAGGDRAAARAALDVPEGAPLIGTVAALRAEKNLYRMIDAFALLPEESGARLVLVGDGKERQGLEAHVAAKSLGARVRFTGALAQPETVLAGLDIFALSSDTEQMPVSVLEAMAMDLPVASVDVGDVRAMVAQSNQPYIAGREAAGLAASLQQLIQDPDLRRRLSADNREHVRATFDEKVMFGAYDRLFKEKAR